MGDKTKISWTGPNGHTQNFWIGCKAVSPGCGTEGGKCYAQAWTERVGWDFDQVTRTKTRGSANRFDGALLKMHQN